MANEEINDIKETRPHSRLNEIVAFAILAFAIMVFLSLVTYAPSDWSLNTSTEGEIKNWTGIVGSVFSDLILQVIGFAAYFFPVMLALVAWRCFRSLTFTTTKWRVIGYVLFFVSMAGLSTMLGFRGGIIGAAFASGFAWMLGGVGASLVLSLLFVSALYLVTDVSLKKILGSFWRTSGLESSLNSYTERFRVWRNLQKENALARLRRRREVFRAPAVIENNAQPTITIGEIETFENQEEIPSTEIAAPRVRRKAASASGNGREELASGDDIGIGSLTDFARNAVKRKKATVTDDAKSISISPVKHTGDLPPIEDSPFASDAESEAIPDPIKAVSQNFENFVLPLTEFLTPGNPPVEQEKEELFATAKELGEKCGEFNVGGRVVNISQGPVVTTYEFKPDPGVKYSRVTGLADDLCLALRAESVRIDRIPGKAYVGIEVPNGKRETIFLRDVIESKKFRDSTSLLSIALGKTIDGLNYVSDLSKMPHLLIAGATGAGKSVGVNSLVVSILYKARPDQVKFIMVDPKRLELGVYADIPHLATPIITDPKRAAQSLKWAVVEMERRYKELAGWGVRNIDGFNTEVARRNSIEQLDDNGEPWKPLPYIVIIIDELADLMMVAGKDVEDSITRLAQMARAVGIHLVLATQRPSVDVITGLIKANFPARISFRVSSKVDSRTIIDANGAERLLGRGDMLFLPPGTSQILRVHGTFVDEREIAKIVDHIKAQGKPEYDTSITKTQEELEDPTELPGKKDPLFVDALRSVISAKRASTSLLQRHLRIGYGRAAAILDAMVREGYIGEMDGSSRARPVLQNAYDALEMMESSEEQ